MIKISSYCFIKKRLNLLLHIFLLICFTNCTKNEKIDNQIVNFKYHVKWDLCKNKPNAYTIYLYPKDHSKYIKYQSNNSKDRLNIKRGRYDVLLINNTVDAFANLTFQDEAIFDVFSVFIDIDKRAHLKKPKIYALPQELDVAVLRNIEINSQQSFCVISPRPIFANIKMQVFVKGVENLAKKGTMVEVGPMYKGKYLASGEPILGNAYHLIQLNRSRLSMNNQLKANFYSLGLEKSISQLIFHFCMNNNQYLSSVKREIGVKVDDAAQTTLIRIGDDFKSQITVPKLEDVDPSSGFEVDVDNWGDDIDIDLE